MCTVLPRLFIAEKASLGKAIAEGLGITSRSKDCIICRDGDVVCWLAGHVLEMLKPDEM